MVALNPQDVERVFFHLGFPAREGVPSGDVLEVNRAVVAIASITIRNYIVETLDILDLLWRATNPIDTSARFAVRELYAGDVNRSVIRDIAAEMRLWRQFYLQWTDVLAQTLAVPNYNSSYDALRFSRAGESFVRIENLGPNDTATGSGIFEWARTGGGFGIP